MYHYNVLTQFYKKHNGIVLKSQLQTVTIDGNDGLYEFLVYAVENQHITQEDTARFGISTAMIELLVKYGYIIPVVESNNGLEALGFHNYISNPNSHNIVLDDYQLRGVYVQQQDRLHQLINRKVFQIDEDKSLKSLEGLCNKEVVDSLNTNQLFSTRCDEAPNSIDMNYLFSALSYLNTKCNSHYLYGSGGGLYGVFELVVTRDDNVLLANKEKYVVYKTRLNGLFEQLSSSIIQNPMYSASSYGAIVILLADTSLVFKKYGNRGYRYIMMEAGAIGLLFRMLYSKRGYLELGGYNDKLICKIIESSDLFVDMKDLIITHLILLRQ